MTSNLPVSSFESDRRRFLGDNEYGTRANSLSLQKEELSNCEALRGDNIGALLHRLGTIRPGETARPNTQLGQADSIQNALLSMIRYRESELVEQALRETHACWDNYLARLQVEIPDASMNRMLNTHNPGQWHMTKNWSRYLSLYQLGLGARGIGFRDSSKDAMGILNHTPAHENRLGLCLSSAQHA
jgi:cellobiose phosphorylase